MSSRNRNCSGYFKEERTSCRDLDANKRVKSYITRHFHIWASRNILEQEVIIGTMPEMKRDTTAAFETATLQYIEDWTTDTETLPGKTHDHNYT